MTDADDLRPTDPEAPAAPPPAPPVPPAGPAYGAAPDYPPPGPHPSYAAPRPRFVDQVLGMRAVIAVALASLVIGGLGGALLGAATDNGNDDFRGGFPGGFQQDGTLPGPNQLPNPQQQFGQGRTAP